MLRWRNYKIFGGTQAKSTLDVKFTYGKKVYYVVLVWVGVVDTSHALKRLGQPELQTGAIPSQRVT